MKELGFLVVIIGILLSGCMVPRRLESARDAIQVQVSNGQLQAGVRIGTLKLLGQEFKEDFWGTSRDVLVDTSLILGTGLLINEALEAQSDDKTTVVNNPTLSGKSAAQANSSEKDLSQFASEEGINVTIIASENVDINIRTEAPAE